MSAFHWIIQATVICWFATTTVKCFMEFLPVSTALGDKVIFQLQLTIPYTIDLPIWVGRRRKRTAEAVDFYSTGNVWTMYNLKSVEGVIISRLEALFHYIGIRNDDCKRRLLCLMSNNPDKYYPLSDVLLQHLSPLNEHLLKMEVNSSSHLWQYVELFEAGKKGFIPGINCFNETRKCFKNPNNTINWSFIKVLQYLMKYVGVQFLSYRK